MGAVSPVSCIPLALDRYRSAAALVLVLPFLLLTMLSIANPLTPSARASGGPPAEASARGAGLGARPFEKGARFEHRPGAARIICDVVRGVRCEFSDGLVPISSPCQDWSHPLVGESESTGGDPCGYAQKVGYECPGCVVPPCLSRGQKFLALSPSAGCVSKVSSVATSRAR